MGRLVALLSVCLTLICLSSVYAQPSPKVQQRISAAIKAAANSTNIDYTAFVNPFIGTDNDGDVCPGASVPFGMAKFSTDLTGYAPAGYIVDPTQKIRGLSPLHDSGTGSSLGSYGNFEIMPLLCPRGFHTCTTLLTARERFRKNNTDDASPGYFAQTLDNNIKMEATSTRRAGLERFTFPKGSKPYFALDLANDLPASFAGGTMDLDPEKGRVTIGGFWGSRDYFDSFGPPSFHYQAFACYDLLSNANGTQKLDEYGMWTGDTFGLDQKALGVTHLNLSIDLIGGAPYQSGALFSFANNTQDPIIIRVGVSFVSADQACANAESEVGDASFEEIVSRSKALWQDKLRRIEIDVANTPPNVTEMLYSSLYRSFLTPNNATGETQGPFANTTSPYFDSLYCSWDTFRTFYPLMALHSPADFAEIVENYIDGWRKTGWMPECRSNNVPGYTQGGSDGDNIVSHFAITYHNEAAQLGVDINELYSALKTDAEVNPPEWNIHGRQVNVYKQYGYVPYAVFDPASTGRQTREGSRTLEYAFNDFGVRQVALLLGNKADVETYTNRSLFYRNVWDPNVRSDGFKGFMEKRFPNGTFVELNPIDCSPQDNTSRPCSLTADNENGFYESSSWEYSFFVPHDTAHLIELMGGNATFVKRLDHFFSAGYFAAGNEPSFQTPIGYHYANQPAKSVDQVRNVVFSNFDITPAGLPGNDDQAAMATLLIFHLLGLYPVPSTSQLLILSPFTPKYTIHNTYLNTSTTVTVHNFSPHSIQHTIPKGVPAYVSNVTVNGKPTESRCHFDFYDTFRLGGEIEIMLSADRDGVDSCAGRLPESISTGGFASVR
ncbi:glycoside hydrolase family 92 protein [Fomitiporia mediterranea MF3/22]|uniref:glycoside hydrolase family 92 protein n=1 Tax=Fomitiporia mediterranea (strain MF3/22) TaxID=694068 RepID=UPI0004407685|nr:glycoside hydrolase family 92 protein [Fomitiporia mediterranea MF3/22]EJD03194.1 glycoside hydrolase family 92 protein [Fomitiporia mediterranea MF3/22]